MTTTPLPPLPTPPDDRPHLTARLVLSDADALAMGAIRDRQRGGFSHDTSPIDAPRQLDWWRTNRDRVLAYLYSDAAGAVVGYGCLRQGDDGRWYSSVAVDHGHERLGYGKAITTHLVLSVGHEVWATARDDNPAAQALHDRLIWDTLGWHEGLWLYRTKPKIRLAPHSLNLDDHGAWAGEARR